jgi:undecaprenyl-diphosphatase
VFGLTGCSVVLAAGGETGLGLRTAAAGSLAWFAAQVTKDVVDRRRPYELGTAELLVSVPHGSSWPSGHAAVAGAMADTLAHELPRAGGIAAWLVAVGVAASRLHVGVHHATDTIAGLAMGALAGEATRVAADAITSRRDA